jgi:peptidoglycan/LPS O-acetylase OafA/YrhL
MGARPRLIHVDNMRPIKQVGVIGTHSLLIFAPVGSVGAGAALLATHFTRFAFVFISTAMLAYAYPQLPATRLRPFWRHRLFAVAIPYVTWTVIYYVVQSLPLRGIPVQFRPTSGVHFSPLADLGQLAYLLATGYYQLYYLLLLMELYLIYPLLAWLVFRTAGKHGLLLACSFCIQMALTSLEHWARVPAWMQGGVANKGLWNYQLYLIAGAVTAFHYAGVHAWICRNWRLVLVATAWTGGLAEGWYLLGATHVFTHLAGGGASSPFQPVVVPFYLCLIACLYLLGVVLSSPRMPEMARTGLATAGTNSYGIYLSQVLFLMGLAVLGWSRLQDVIAWPWVVLGAVVIVYAASNLSTSGLARLPGAMATAGRARVRPPSQGLAQPAEIV